MKTPSEPARIAWSNVVLAALLMLATLPGRTQGLGLITEPLLRDLQLDRVTYGNVNLWATLIGSAFCLPAGWLLDRLGLRWVTTAIVLLLGFAVWRLSAHTGGVAMLFVWILLTRALGQSALSVASITAVSKGGGRKSGLAMGVYAVLLSLFMATAFGVIGQVISKAGWRVAWEQIALVLLLGIAPLTLLFLREPGRTAVQPKEETSGLTLTQALRTPLFWGCAGAIAMFGLASSGLGLFNEAVLAEAGFAQGSFHAFLAVSTLFALLGQMLCGWLTLRRSMPALLGLSMFLYAASLAALPALRTLAQLWVLAGVMGVAAGFITVIFFALWSQAFGRAHLGRIQGAVQTITVVASAIGPLLFAQCHALTGSYAPLLYSLAPLVLLIGLIVRRMPLPQQPASLAVSD